MYIIPLSCAEGEAMTTEQALILQMIIWRALGLVMFIVGSVAMCAGFALLLSKTDKHYMISIPALVFGTIVAVHGFGIMAGG